MTDLTRLRAALSVGVAAVARWWHRHAAPLATKLALMRALKQALDPQARMNPGKVLP